MIRRIARLGAAVCLFGLTATLPANVAAHFALNVNIRVIHVQHLDDGLRVLLRLPAPYVLAPLVGPAREDGTAEPAPYTSNRLEEGRLLHYLDLEAVREAPLGLGALVARGHRIEAAGQTLRAEVESTRVYRALSQPPFATLDEAEAAFVSPQSADGQGDPYVGDTVIDVVLVYAASGPVASYSFYGELDPGLEGQDETANLLLDYWPGETLVFRERGLLDRPIEVSRSALEAAYTFMREGVRHILEGTDHVLFVLCLVIGASRLSSLLWRVTGFTVGHTVTLIAGFFGWVPGGAWFVPAVETGIALSIVYAAAIALSNRESRSAYLITPLIGLLHGLGFSFVLHEILRVDSPNLWQSLLSFNLGVEVGQLAIVLIVWPVFWLLARRREQLAATARWVVALPCIVVASLWTVERVTLLVDAI